MEERLRQARTARGRGSVGRPPATRAFSRGLIQKGNQTSRPAQALSFGGGLGSGDPSRPAPTLLRAAGRVAPGQFTARTGLPGVPRAGHAVVLSLTGSLLSILLSPPSGLNPLTLALARGAFPPPFGVPCHRTWGGRTRGPGVQPAAVECLFSKDSEIKKVEFTDSPESRKEAASSKLFPRQHPGANGKGEGSAGRAPGSRLRDSGPPVKPWRAKLLEPVCPRCRT